MQPDAGYEETTDLNARSAGTEWLIDATGCDQRRLGDRAAIERLFLALIETMRLHPVQPAAWHQFPGHGGITGVCLLAESHLTCHTFPEHGSLCLDLFCCKPRAEASWEALFRAHVGARMVRVTRVDRTY